MTQPLHAAATLRPAHPATVYKDRIVTWAKLRERTARLAGAIRRLGIDEGQAPARMLAYEEMLGASEAINDECPGGDNLAGIYYTGGTTGFPKGVMLSHQALWYNGLAVAKHACFEPDARYLHVAPMFHLADAAGGMGAMMARATHYFVPSFTPEGVIDSLSGQGITHVLMVPSMIGMLLQHPAFSADAFRNLRYLIYGASPMPEGLLRQTIEKLPDVGLVQGYGQTEMAPLVTTLAPDRHVIEGPLAGKLRSAGQVIFGCEVEIRDQAGSVLPHGEIGEICARSPGSMIGYWKLPEQTANTLDDGWVKTGDLAYMDEDGFIFIVDRAKDMIVSGGENVFSAEVESVITTHPAVAGVAVIGIPHETWGEAVHAIVIPATGAQITAAEIINHCRVSLAHYKCPKSIEFRHEPFPLSGAGKVLKRELRAPYWEGRTRQIS